MTSFLNLPNELISKILHNCYDTNSHLRWFICSIPLVSRQFYDLSLKLRSQYLAFENNNAIRKYQGTLSGGSAPCTVDFQQYDQDDIFDYLDQNALDELMNKVNSKRFLFSFMIENALDKRVLGRLFDSEIQSIDLTGLGTQYLSTEEFDVVLPSVSGLTQLCFHQASCIPDKFFLALFPTISGIQKLDLTGTLVSEDSLSMLPLFENLTHLSLGSLKLTKNTIFDCFTNQQNFKNSLKWLNLQTNFNSLTEDELLMILQSLVNNRNTTLEYLNLNGRLVTYEILKFLNFKFASLKALHIYKSAVSQQELKSYLDENASLKYINIAGNKNIVPTAQLLDSYSLDCWEFSPFTIKQDVGDWKMARTLYRAWLYKPSLQASDPCNGFEMKNKLGQKIVVNHRFLKFASNKVQLDDDEVWQENFRSQSIYNEFALNTSNEF